MILVRNVFRLKFGKAKEAKALMKENEALVRKHGNNHTRWLTDITGPFYTFVMETTYANLSELERTQSEAMGSKEFSDWYQKFTPLVDSGYREVFTIVS